METNNEKIKIYKNSNEEIKYIPKEKIVSYKFCDNNNDGFEIDFESHTVRKISKNKTIVYRDVNKINLIKDGKKIIRNDETGSTQIIKPIKIETNAGSAFLPMLVKGHFKPCPLKDCFSKMNLSSFPISSIEETINVSGNENDTTSKIILTINNTKNEINCKYIYGNSGFKLTNQYDTNEFKFENTKSKKNNNIQLDQADEIIKNLLSKSRCNGDFGLENSLINAKLALLNAKRQNNDVQIIPAGWSEETQSKEYSMIAKRLEDINKGLILIPIFSNCHVSTLIVEKEDNKIIKCASFDSSTDHLSKDKSQVECNALTNLLSNIEEVEMKILNRDDLQILDQSRLEDKSFDNIKRRFLNKKDESIKLGNCGYYTLSFMEHIIANSHKYRSIDEICGDINSIKETVQKKVDETLKYYETAEVLKKFLENRQKQGNFGSRLRGTIIAEQYHEMAHAIIADKFKCFNSNIEQPIQQNESERQQSYIHKQIQSGNNIVR